MSSYSDHHQGPFPPPGGMQQPQLPYNMGPYPPQQQFPAQYYQMYGQQQYQQYLPPSMSHTELLEQAHRGVLERSASVTSGPGASNPLTKTLERGGVGDVMAPSTLTYQVNEKS